MKFFFPATGILLLHLTTLNFLAVRRWIVIHCFMTPIRPLKEKLPKLNLIILLHLRHQGMAIISSPTCSRWINDLCLTLLNYLFNGEMEIQSITRERKLMRLIQPKAYFTRARGVSSEEGSLVGFLPSS